MRSARSGSSLMAKMPRFVRGHEAVVEGELVGQVAALGHLDRVDLADEVGDRRVGRGELLAVATGAVDPLDRACRHRARPRSSRRVARHRRVRVVVDLGAGDDRHPLVEQVGERADHAGLRLAALAEEDHVVAGEQGVLELRQDGVLVALHHHGKSTSPDWMRAMALRRSSSFTGTETHPDSRSWPTVAGAGCSVSVHLGACDGAPAEERPRSPAGRGTPERGHGANLSPAPCCARSGAVAPLDLDRYPRLLHGGARGDLASRGRRRRPPPHLARRRLRRHAAGRPSTVPGHWRSAPAFADTDGPLLYRRSFDAMGPAEGRRAWLTFDGLFYQGDVWLDGSLPRRHRGLLRPAHLRGHRRARAPAASTTSASRSPARARPTSRPSATSPASSSTGTASTPTGTPAASGGRSA